MGAIGGTMRITCWIRGCHRLEKYPYFYCERCGSYMMRNLEYRKYHKGFLYKFNFIQRFIRKLYRKHLLKVDKEFLKRNVVGNSFKKRNAL